MKVQTHSKVFPSDESVGQSATDGFAIERIMSPSEVFEALYGNMDDSSLVSMASRRLTKVGGESPHYLTVIPKEGLEEHLKLVLNCHPEQTKYICTNPISRSAIRWTDPKRYIESLLNDDRPLYFEAKNRHVKELAALPLDLDVGRSSDDLTAFEAHELVRRKVSRGEIPAPSLVAHSGRGLYIFYLLMESCGDWAPPKTGDTIKLYNLIKQELLQRTSDLKSDPRATRLANWFKAPGTVDTKTGKEVIYTPFGQSIPNYTLHQLMDSLEIVEDRSRQRSWVTRDRSAPKPNRELTRGRAKSAVPYLKRYEDIVKLAEFREGIHEGSRTEILYQVFSSLRAAFSMVHDLDVAKEAAMARLLGFNETYCNPPKSPDELKKIFTSPRYPHEPRSETVALKLGVTLVEAEVCDLRALKPREMRMKEEKVKQAKREVRERKWQLVDKGIEAGKTTDDILLELRGLGIEVTSDYIYHRRSRLKKLQKAAPNECLMTSIPNLALLASDHGFHLQKGEEEGI